MVKAFDEANIESGHIWVFMYEDSVIISNYFWWWMWSHGCIEHISLKDCADTGLLHLWIADTKLCAFLLIWVHASIRQWIIVMKRSSLVKSILEVPWVHCNGLYEMNTCSYGSFIKVLWGGISQCSRLRFLHFEPQLKFFFAIEGNLQYRGEWRLTRLQKYDEYKNFLRL